MQSCTAALAVGPMALERGKQWLSDEEQHRNIHRYTLGSHLIARENFITPYYISNPAKVGAILRFNAPTSAEQVIWLFSEVLKSLPPEESSKFLNKLRHAVGQSSIKTGEEISFYWFDNEDLLILHNGEIQETVHSPLVNRLLIDAFASAKSISRDLYLTIVEMIPFVHEK
jgi:hypothetical protein